MATTGITGAPNKLPIGAYHITKHHTPANGVVLHPLQQGNDYHFPVTFNTANAAPIARTPPLGRPNFTGTAVKGS